MNDGSTDGTLAILEKLSRAEPRIRVLTRPRNRGLGQTLREGFAAARHDVVLYSDADMPYDLSIVKDALPLLRDCDLVAGYRLNRGEGLKRRLYSRAYNGLVRRVFGLRVRDVNFSFKLFKRALLESVSLESAGSFIDAELLAKAQRAGFRIREIGIEYRPRRTGASNLSSLSTILTILREGFAARRRLGPAPRTDPARHFRGGSWKDRWHARCRWSSAPFEALEERLPREGAVLDYGCGHGLFSFLLAERAAGRSVRGFDIDERKLGLARRRFPALPNLAFDTRDPASQGTAFTGAALVDVLQYLPRGDKEALLKKVDALLRPGGTLLIKEIDTSPLWKYLWTYAQELAVLHVLRATRRATGHRGMFYEDAAWYRARLEELGQSVDVVRLDGGRLHPHVMIVGRKRA